MSDQEYYKCPDCGISVLKRVLHFCDHRLEIKQLRAELAAAKEEAYRLRLWLLGIIEDLGGEVSNVDPMKATEETIWHGIVRIASADGSDMYLTQDESNVADWNDSPFGKAEWVVQPRGV